MVPRVIGMSPVDKKPAKGAVLTEKGFMEKCPSEFAPFFQKVIEQANEKIFSIYWAKQAFLCGSIFLFQ